MNERHKKLIGRIDDEIKNLDFGREPPNLYDPIRYILNLGGKRIRPLLAILSYRLFRDDINIILQPAIAIEIFHNFTLMHDDIMDRAPLRRGKKTVHNRWNENIAILSGDVMLVRAYDRFLALEKTLVQEVIAGFNDCAARVCEGQQMDMDFEKRSNVQEEEYIRMIGYKTAELLGFSLDMGACIGLASPADRIHLRAFGMNIGIGFQLMDDLLDVYSDHQKFGKQTGGDIISNKKTYLLIKALETAEKEDNKALQEWLAATDFDPGKKVEAVKKIYNRLNIPGITKSLIDTYFQLGFNELEMVTVAKNRKSDLINLADYLMKREL